MNIIKRIIRVIVVSIIILVATFNIYNFINIKILKKDLSTINGYSILEVVSGSMEPTIKVGDLIVIDTKTTSYEENDIITFYDVNDSFVTHRIVSINDETMITRGDANDSDDDELDTSRIVGKYKFKITFLGLVLASLKSPITLILILIIGILVCYLISTDSNGNLKDIEEPKKDKSTKEKKKIVKPTIKGNKEVVKKTTTTKKNNKKKKKRKNKKKK